MEHICFYFVFSPPERVISQLEQIFTNVFFMTSDGPSLNNQRPGTCAMGVPNPSMGPVGMSWPSMNSTEASLSTGFHFSVFATFFFTNVRTYVHSVRSVLFFVSVYLCPNFHSKNNFQQWGLRKPQKASWARILVVPDIFMISISFPQHTIVSIAQWLRQQWSEVVSTGSNRSCYLTSFLLQFWITTIVFQTPIKTKFIRWFFVGASWKKSWHL